MKIVLNTNVLVSALINPDGKPALILNLILNGKLTLLYDNRILKEYFEVLSRRKFGFSKYLIEDLLSFFKYEGEFITAEPSKIEMQDEDDRKFLEVAISGNADYLITGNLKHFPKYSFILNPETFIEKIKKEL